jgi:hypothetical protein
MTTLTIAVFIGVLVISNLITYKIGLRIGTIKSMDMFLTAMEKALKQIRDTEEEEPEDQCSQ